jgi:bacteriocin-like protein
MTKLNNEIRELDINELDAISGGGDVIQGVSTVLNVFRIAADLGGLAAESMLNVAIGSGKP